MKKVDFDNGTITQNIIQTALPMLVAQVISLLYNIVDRIYIGRIEGYGTQALGAIGLCFPIVMLIGGFTNMFGLGGAPLFSIELGKNDREKAGDVLNTAFRLEIIAGAALMVLCGLFAPKILAVFGATADELYFSVPYIRIYLSGTIFAMISTGINPYINAQGYSTIGMKSVLVGAISNIILDPIFIFTLGLGVSGAAIATVLSQFLSMLFVMKFLLGPKNEFKISFGNFFSFPYAKEIASLGLSPFVMQCTNSLVSVACNGVLMETGGAVYVSVMTIISSVRQILDTPIMAVTEGASPTISYNYGAGRPKRVQKAIALMAVTAILYTCLMWILIEKFPLLFIKIFSDDAALQRLAVRPLHLYFFAFVFQAFQYSGQTVFKALNKKKQAIFFSLFRKVIMVVPLTYLLPYAFGMGTDGVFMAEPISNVIGGVACFITMVAIIVPELRGMGGEQKLEIFDSKFVSALRPKTGYAQVLAMPGHKSHGEMEKVMKNVEIRPADIGDAEDILKIYTYYVTETAISFEYDVPTLDDFKGRMEKILEKYPYFVAVCDNRVVGYAYAGAFVGRAAYAWSVEATIYIDASEVKRGIGKMLYETLENALMEMEITNLYACIGYTETEDEYLNANSAQFHEHMGFEKCGEFHKCGYKFGRWYDMIWMEKIIGRHGNLVL